MLSMRMAHLGCADEAQDAKFPFWLKATHTYHAVQRQSDFSSVFRTRAVMWSQLSDHGCEFRYMRTCGLICQA